MSKTALLLADIHQSFQQAGGALDVLRGVQLELQQGEVVALLGPSGSGKSCLLHIAGLLTAPDSGTIKVAEQNVAVKDEKARTLLRRRHIGFVYQAHNLLPEFTAQENVALPLRLNDVANGQAQSKAADLLEKLGLGARLAHLPSQLSGGEQQRVAIARALVNQPALVLADEPTGSLDGAAAQGVADMFLQTARAQNAAVLLATHDLALAGCADRIISLSEGLIQTN
ncbi:MAG: ABC transporter ATP-binding protein [Parvibaculales bacterium]